MVKILARVFYRQKFWVGLARWGWRYLWRW